MNQIIITNKIYKQNNQIDKYKNTEEVLNCCSIKTSNLKNIIRLLGNQGHCYIEIGNDKLKLINYETENTIIIKTTTTKLENHNTLIKLNDMLPLLKLTYTKEVEIKITATTLIIQSTNPYGKTKITLGAIKPEYRPQYQQTH